MTPTPRISVIIPHLNTPDLLAISLTSVFAQTLDHGIFEVIVVDNGSALPLQPVVAAFPAVRFLTEPAPGPGLARNTGIAAARSTLIACIDADCIAESGWLQAAVDALDADPAHPAGGDIQVAARNPTRFTGIEAYEAVFGFRQRLYIDIKHFSVTANLAMTKALHITVGGFGDISIAEDLDWGQRAHALGHSTRFVPAMRVRHPARPDLSALKRKWRRHISHDWHSLGVTGSSRITWHLKALALFLSTPFEAIKLLSTDRVPSLSSRLAGIAVLAHIRTFRAIEMQRITHGSTQASADFWNRAG